MVAQSKLIIAVLAVLALVVLLPHGGAPAAIAGGTGGGVPAPGAVVVCPGLTTGFTQTLSAVSYDADKAGTSVSTGPVLVFTDATKGIVNPGNTSTTPGHSYTAYMVKSNYFSTVGAITTACTDSAPVLRLNQKAVDTAITISAKDSDGQTTNNDNSGIQAIGTGGAVTLHAKLSQSAAYKHISGDSGYFVAYVNATNMTDWNPSQMSMVIDSTPCVSLQAAGLSNTATPTALVGTLVFSQACKFDFAPNDGSIHDLAIRVQAASTVNPGNQTVSLAFAGVDYYQNSISGAIEQGSVKDNGAAVQTLQGTSWQVN